LLDESEGEYSRMLEAGTGLEKVTVVKGELFVVVGIPAFNEEKTIARVVLEAQKYAYRVVAMTEEIAERLGAGLRGCVCFEDFFGCFLNYLALGDFLEVFYGEVYVKDSVEFL